MSQLKNYQSRVFILYLNNLPFINDKGPIFYPEWLHVIPPKEFLIANKLAIDGQNLRGLFRCDAAGVLEFTGDLQGDQLVKFEQLRVVKGMQSPELRVAGNAGQQRTRHQGMRLKVGD